VETVHRSIRAQLYTDALQRLESAVDILDRANAPGHIAAHIDLAMHQLKSVIDAEIASTRTPESAKKAAPH
jgi:hypothetical protein